MSLCSRLASCARKCVPGQHARLQDDEAEEQAAAHGAGVSVGGPGDGLPDLAEASSHEATAASLLDGLLTSLLPAVRRAICETLHKMVTEGTTISGGMFTVSVERKMAKGAYVQLGGAGFHSGAIDRARNEAEAAPLVADEIVKKLEVNVLSVKAGTSLTNGRGGAASALDASTLVVEATIQFFVHFTKAREATAGAHLTEQLSQLVQSNDQTVVGANAVEFCVLCAERRPKHPRAAALVGHSPAAAASRR